MRGATLIYSNMGIGYELISIHAPHAGRDAAGRDCGRAERTFQSTRPMRGATAPLPRVSRWRGYFNPRAPCGARRARGSLRRGAINISIHAPHAGRDEINAAVMRSPPYFNPRAPCGARPACRTGQSTTADFNPRAPCGARRLLIEREDVLDEFQSTRPMRGATFEVFGSISYGNAFQSTRPMRGATGINARTVLP